MNSNSPALIRVWPSGPRPKPELVARFAAAPTGNICDAMDRFGAMDYRIRALDSSLRLCGPALTVRTRPCDNLVIYQALEIAQPGDVMVIATYEHLAGSTFGDLVAAIAQKKGLAGIVCDGLCRDARGIRALHLPVFVRGTSPASPFKDGPGEVNSPVSCGGITVHSGDLIAADEDGVVVVPARDLADVASRLEGIRQKEESLAAEIDAGKLISDAIASRLASVSVERLDREPRP